MLNITRLFLLILIIPAFTFAQVPKAYENIYYSTTLGNTNLKFALANGYISYSKIQLFEMLYHKPVVFEAADGIPDQHDRLKFITYKPDRHDYFILDNMLEAYQDVPSFISGKYYLKGKIRPIKFKLIRLLKGKAG